MVTIMQAIAGASFSSSISKLDLSHVSMEHMGAMALVRALDASLPNLRALDISSNPGLGDHVMAIIIRALAAHGRLSSLLVSMTGMGISAGMVLVEALRDGVWPSLRVLMTADNPALLNDSVVLDLIKLLKRGNIAMVDGLGQCY